MISILFWSEALNDGRDRDRMLQTLVLVSSYHYGTGTILSAWGIIECLVLHAVATGRERKKIDEIKSGNGASWFRLPYRYALRAVLLSSHYDRLG